MAGRAGSIPEWALVKAYRAHQKPECRVCKCVYPRPVQAVFDKHPARVAQSVDGTTNAGRAAVHAKNDNDKVAGKAKDEVSRLGNALEQAQRRIKELEGGGGGPAAGASGSPGGPKPASPTEDDDTLADLQSRIDSLTKLLKEAPEQEKEYYQTGIDRLLKDKAAKRAKKDAERPLRHRYAELQGKVDKETRAYEQAKQAREDHEKRLPDLQKAEAEALARLEEAKVSFTRLHKEQMEKEAEPEKVALALLRESIAAVGISTQEPQQALTEFEAVFIKFFNDHREAQAAAAKALPEDAPMEMDDNLPSAVSTPELLWLHSRPPKQPGQTDEDHNRQLLEWAKGQPAATAGAAGVEAKKEGPKRGRTDAYKDGEGGSRERSRSDKGP